MTLTGLLGERGRGDGEGRGVTVVAVTAKLKRVEYCKELVRLFVKMSSVAVN